MEILRTERLKLRWFTLDDAPFMLNLLTEPSWKKNISDPGVHDLDGARAWMEGRLFKPYWRDGHGFWAVERLADGEVIGLAGLFKRDFLDHADVGYGFLERHWGQGYAREAAAACRDYARRVFGMPAVWAITAPHNEPSMRVLRDLGFTSLGLRKYDAYEDDSALFEWRAPVADAAPADDAAQIDALVERFLGAFSNRAGTPTIAALPHWLLPNAVISQGKPDGSLAVMDVRGFVEPRAELLFGGRLQDFAEWQTEEQTRIEGRIAQRWLRYRKSGVLDGAAFEGEGVKTLQFAKTDAGWRIAAVAWTDL